MKAARMKAARAHFLTAFAMMILAGEALAQATEKLELNAPQTQRPATANVDISALAIRQNRLSECRVTGQVILWVSRAVEVLDDVRVSLGAIEAGLAQFGKGSKLQGCVPDGGTLDLSDRFANFLVADDPSLRRGALGRREAAGFASQLAQNFYQLAEPEGTPIPLVEGIKMSAIGSFSYRFIIVLVRDAKSGSIDAVIHRETLGTKFSPQLTVADRCLSRLKWSSLQ
jgi:hypothetical protein